MAVDVYVMNENGVCLDRDQKPCQFENPKSYFASEETDYINFNTSIEFKLSPD